MDSGQINTILAKENQFIQDHASDGVFVSSRIPPGRQKKRSGPGKE